MATSRVSAGLLIYRSVGGEWQVLLVHPGGPFFRKKDEGAWTIPKGEPDPGEDLLATAVREVREEVGAEFEGPFLPLTPVKQKGGKTVHAWAVLGDCEPEAIAPNTVAIEWPPRSGRREEFPEIDRAAFFALDKARRKINPAQVALIDELERIVTAEADVSRGE